MEADVLIVGAGPAGLTAAAELRRLGVAHVVVADRETAPGGIPRHSEHAGYGLRDLHRVLSGPAYARALTDMAASAGAQLRAGCTVTDLRAAADPPGGGAGDGLSGDGDGDGARPGGVGLSCVLTSATGIEQVRAKAVLLATGCRERPRAARLIPGDRPSGVLTTGELQQRVYLAGERLDGRALIVGAEHVSFSAALTLAHAGARVIALVTDQPRHASYAAFALGTALRWHVPVWTSAAVTRVTGAAGRLASVNVAAAAGADAGEGAGGGAGAANAVGGQTRTVACEWLVFTGDWIPDHVLARTAGIALDPGTRGPAIDTTMATSTPGVFAAGNLVHAAETADVAALSGRHAARQIAAYLAGGPPAEAPSPATVPTPAQARVPVPVPVIADPPLRWISPNAVAIAVGAGFRASAIPAAAAGTSAAAVPPPLGRFAIRAAEFRERARLEARQDGRLLARSRPLQLIPGRPVHLRASWLASVDPAGGPVRVGLPSD